MAQFPVYLAASVAAAVFGVLGWVLARRRAERLHGQSVTECDRLLADAHREAASIVKAAELAAREETYRTRQRFEAETETVRRETRTRQEAFDRREDSLDRKAALVDQKEARLVQQEDDLRRRLADADLVLAAASAALKQQTERLDEIFKSPCGAEA